MTLLLDTIAMSPLFWGMGSALPQKFTAIKLKDKISNILHLLSENLKKNKDLFYDSQEIWDDLAKRGFSDGEIERALLHIEHNLLETPGPFWSEALPLHRVYTLEEMSRLPNRVRGYLWRLKCRGVIDHALEDEIVNKAMNLEEPAGIREIKTVAALTVFGYEQKFQGGSLHHWEADSHLN